MAGRALPAALLALAVLTTFRPDPTIVAGDAPTASPVTPSFRSSPDRAAPTPTAAPTSANEKPLAFAAGHLSPEERAAPDGVLPARIRIPAIDVDAIVGSLGLHDDGSIEVPTDFSATGWWTYSPRPGRVGTSVILGHVDSKTGPAVFFRLKDLRPGDRIMVAGEAGDTVTFAVDHVEQHPKADFPTQHVFGATPEPSLRLITCGGAFDAAWGHHLDNLVVFADRVA